MAAAALGTPLPTKLAATGLPVTFTCTEYMAYSYIDVRSFIFEPAGIEVIGGVRTTVYDGAIPMIFNGRRFEPTAGWSNPWPYGSIRAT